MYIVTNNETQHTWSFSDENMAIACAQLFDRATVHELAQDSRHNFVVADYIDNSYCVCGESVYHIVHAYGLVRTTVDPLRDTLVWVR